MDNVIDSFSFLARALKCDGIGFFSFSSLAAAVRNHNTNNNHYYPPGDDDCLSIDLFLSLSLSLLLLISSEFEVFGSTHANAWHTTTHEQRNMRSLSKRTCTLTVYARVLSLT